MEPERRAGYSTPMRLGTVLPQGKPYDVVGFGLNAVDHLCRVARFPEIASKIQLDEYACRPGGQIATAMVALRRWGHSAAYLGAFGTDEFGDIARNALLAEGVAIEGCITRPGARNQLAVIIIDAVSGERTVLWHRDAALAVRPDELARDRVCAGRVLHLDGFDCDAAVEAAGWAAAEGIPTVLDMDRPQAGVEALLARIDIAIVSQDFAREFTGRRDPTATLVELARLGCELIVVTRGSEGAVARYHGRTLRIPAFPVECIDTTGAGDVFHAAAIHGLLAGWEVEPMLHFASAAAALQCTRVGAQAGIPSLDDIVTLAATRD
jgi:sugar/nucleoside kinase (ribokinase family)